MKISNDYTKQPMLKREQFLYICNYFNEAKKNKKKENNKVYRIHRSQTGN